MTIHPLTSTTFDTVTTTHQAVLITYRATWCSPCRNFAPVFAGLSEHYPSIRFATVDIDAEPDLARAAGIRSIPTVVLLHHGQVASRHSGVLTATALADLAETALTFPNHRKTS